ncbi:MAG: hypothetical protein KIT36_02795 [Alphaproteobacteria bacterium]|nr:hypothetical protein [Alphaproteobacteria bacterium]
MWLNRQLHALYDDIAREPLPSDVVALIERHAQESAAAEPSADTAAAPTSPTDTTHGDKK